MTSSEERLGLAREGCRPHHGSTAMSALRELADCMVERWRDELERVSPERLLAIQGKIQGVRELLDETKPVEADDLEE